MKNITEYIIEMYRKEDMLRAYHLDLEKFGAQVIHFFPLTNKEKLIQVNFYEDMIQKMKDQSIEKTGHLAELNELVQQLDQLHLDLKTTDENYHHVYQRVKPYIKENLKIAAGKIVSEIQICLNGIYGFLLLKIEDEEIKPEDQKMVNAFGDLLSLLAFKFDERKILN